MQLFETFRDMLEGGTQTPTKELSPGRSVLTYVSPNTSWLVQNFECELCNSISDIHFISLVFFNEILHRMIKGAPSTISQSFTFSCNRYTERKTY